MDVSGNGGTKEAADDQLRSDLFAALKAIELAARADLHEAVEPLAARIANIFVRLERLEMLSDRKGISG